MTWARQRYGGKILPWHLLQPDGISMACGAGEMNRGRMEKRDFPEPDSQWTGKFCRRCQYRYERLQDCDWQGVVKEMEHR